MGFWCPHKRRKFGHRDVQRTDEPVIGKRQSFISQGERPKIDPSLTGGTNLTETLMWGFQLQEL